jgi:hypothetical protein
MMAPQVMPDAMRTCAEERTCAIARTAALTDLRQEGGPSNRSAEPVGSKRQKLTENPNGLSYVRCLERIRFDHG